MTNSNTSEIVLDKMASGMETNKMMLCLVPRLGDTRGQISQPPPKLEIGDLIHLRNNTNLIWRVFKNLEESIFLRPINKSSFPASCNT